MASLSNERVYVSIGDVSLLSPAGCRPVWVAEELLVKISESMSGKRVSLEWGEPDEHGFYTPTLTTQEESI